MNNWKKYIARIGSKIESPIDSLKYWYSNKSLEPQEITIVPYIGYGNQNSIHLKGRVLKKKKRREPKVNDSFWTNFKESYRRFESDEIPGAAVFAKFYSSKTEVISDSEGYFEVNIEHEEKFNNENTFHDIEISLKNSENVLSVGEILIPPSNKDFGIISDIDDTVLKTDVIKKLKMIRQTIFGNSKSRLPFKFVSEFYRGLQKGSDNKSFNPFFYVSGSPWNLYDFLIDFMVINKLPLGPFFLRDWGIDQNMFLHADTHAHKLLKIENILKTYTDLDFILLGDSGEYDPEIYLQVIKDFPQRVKAVYIREITPFAKKRQNIIDEAKSQGVEFLFSKDTLTAALHAHNAGFLSKESLFNIEKKIN